jgi:hypothetical protein
MVLAIISAFIINAGSGVGFLFFFGAVCLVAAFVDLIVGLILQGVDKKEWGRGFLLSSGMFLLVGFAICGPILASM